MELARKTISYFIRMLICKTYQRSSVAALQLTGVITDTITYAPMIPESVKPILIREATQCYFDMWTRIFKDEDNGYDE